jgi:hypothetical protein
VPLVSPRKAFDVSLPEDLQRLQDKEIREAEIFCFDLERFEAQIVEIDMLTLVIRAHLYLEHVLIHTLKDAFPVPDAIQMRRLGFPAKLDLCIAMGLVPKEWSAAVLFINEMRNKVAHRLEFEFTEADRTKLLNLLPSDITQFFSDRLEKSKTDWVFLFRLIVLHFDIARQKRKVRRIREKMSEERLRRVVDQVNKRWP